MKPLKSLPKETSIRVLGVILLNGIISTVANVILDLFALFSNLIDSLHTTWTQHKTHVKYTTFVDCTSRMEKNINPFKTRLEYARAGIYGKCML